MTGRTCLFTLALLLAASLYAHTLEPWHGVGAHPWLAYPFIMLPGFGWRHLWRLAMA